jgi:hypothetical protein
LRELVASLITAILGLSQANVLPADEAVVEGIIQNHMSDVALR